MLCSRNLAIMLNVIAQNILQNGALINILKLNVIR
jgi:hypothetical protein